MDESENPLKWEDGNTDFNKAIDSAGFSLEQYIGETNGIHVEFYSHRKNDDFIVVFNTASQAYPIYCPTLPDALELLARLAPVTLAAMAESEDSHSLAGLPVRVINN
jgi:hypothetical protein